MLVAWAANWSLGQPEADELLRELPELEILGPLAGAIVGAVNLSVRQGWGFIVAVANGIWAGALAVALSGVLYMIVKMSLALQTALVKDFDSFIRVADGEAQPLFEHVVNVPLILITLTATAVVGVATEILHWSLVRLRRQRQRQQSEG
ncbi:MAG: hypothetical protein AAGG06_06445 [Pseudomonadota bacterium]